MTPWKAKMEEQGLFGGGGEAKAMDLGRWWQISKDSRSERRRRKGIEGKVAV